MFARSIIAINLVHAVAVLWVGQAGKHLALYVLKDLPLLPPLAPSISNFVRVGVVLVLIFMGMLYASAIYTLYVSSPMFLCEWDLPVFKGVEFREMPAVRTAALLRR
jgi:hypothetical protein